jgi:hypothetical protein
MSGFFLFVVVMALVAAVVVIKPDVRPVNNAERLRVLRAARTRHADRLRSLEAAPRTCAADIEDEEQALFLIDTEIERVQRAHAVIKT